MMIVGVLQVEIMIHDAMSLKDKRRVVKSIKDRISNKYNVSIAEVGDLDRHRRSVLGISMVGNDGGYIQSSLDKLVDRFRTFHGISLVDYQIEFL